MRIQIDWYNGADLRWCYNKLIKTSTMREDITFIYYFTDNFVKTYQTWIAHKLLPNERVQDFVRRLSVAER
jgi:hypothetical protein